MMMSNTLMLEEMRVFFVSFVAVDFVGDVAAVAAVVVVTADLKL